MKDSVAKYISNLFVQLDLPDGPVYFTDLLGNT